LSSCSILSGKGSNTNQNTTPLQRLNFGLIFVLI